MHLWGWNCKADGRGSFGKRCNYEARSYDEFWVEGVDEAIYPISYSTFHCLWDLHCPTLKIRSPSYDTCSLCFKYTCSLSSIQREANNTSVVLNDILYTNVEDDNGNNEGEEVDDILINFSKQSENESSSCSSTKDREDEKDEEASIEIQESSSESYDHSSDTESDDGKHLNLKHEKLVLEMSEQCKTWKTQREYVKEKKDGAVNDFVNKVLWPIRRDVIVADYMQHLDLPHHGGEQPGDTYYFSPLILFGSEVVDYSIEELDAYIYTKAEGKKGGNNVVSLIHNTLKKKGVIEDAERVGPGKQRTLVFDNCGGQNKNRMVLRYALYLVEKGIYKAVELVFFVCGHSKNVCDRLFKELKQRFHHKNVYNMSQMVSVLNVSYKVHVIRATSKLHYDWDKYFERLYKRPAAGTINKNHIFRADESQRAQLTIERIKGVDAKMQNLNKLKDTSSGTHKGGRTRILKYVKVELIKPPGLKPIKQVEFYTKLRPLVPDEYKDDIRPKPHDSVLKL